MSTPFFDPDDASNSMVMRVAAMAMFIRDHHSSEFGAWFRANWQGSARAAEVLDFYADSDLHRKLEFRRKVYL